MCKNKSKNSFMRLHLEGQNKTKIITVKTILKLPKTIKT